MKIFFSVLFFWFTKIAAGQNLVVQSDNYGIAYISYRGTSLLDKSKNLGVPFGTEAYKVIRKGGKNEWLWTYQSSFKKTGDSEYKYTYNFGEIAMRHKILGDSLLFDITIKNTTTSDTICGINIIPFQVQFPQRPIGFQPYFYYFHYNLDAPTVIPADYGAAKMVLSNENVQDNVFVGLLDVNERNGTLYKLWVSAIPFNGMKTIGVPSLEIRLAPGKSVTYNLGLRFYNKNTPNEKLANSVTAKYKSINKVSFNWNDRRPVGALILASAEGTTAQNPRAWLPNMPIAIKTPEDIKNFKKIIMDYADRSIGILKNMNAQGMITWDIEGQQFPHAISYVGSPDQLNKVAPEMNAIADEYFLKFKKAGFKTGVCIRPQEFVLSKDGKSAYQKDVTDPATVLIRKIKYARQRWGCTLFYIDSNVEPNSALMDVSIIKKVQQAVPDVLLIPEHQDTRYFEYSAPYEELGKSAYGLDGIIRSTYPSAFMVMYTAEAIFDPAGKQKISEAQVADVIKQGNILLFRAWYADEPSNSTIKKLVEKIK